MIKKLNIPPTIYKVSQKYKISNAANGMTPEAINSILDIVDIYCQQLMSVGFQMAWNKPSTYSPAVLQVLNAAIAGNDFFAAGTASRSAMGADLTGTNKWIGGTLGPDGKIYGIPFSSTDILIIDVAAGTASRSAMGADLAGTNKWIGGVLGPDGKIYGIPFGSTDILIIDVAAGTASRSAMGADLAGADKWYGGVLGPDGKIYGIPYGSTDILIIDVAAGKFNVNLLLSGYLNKL